MKSWKSNHRREFQNLAVGINRNEFDHEEEWIICNEIKHKEEWEWIEITLQVLHQLSFATIILRPFKMNANMLSLLGFTVVIHLAFGHFKHIVAFVFALLVIKFTGAISQRSIHSLSGSFISKWIRIVWIQLPRKPPDKITLANLQHSIIELIVFCFATFANANCHQLIVNSVAESTSFKNIVESVSSFAYQINSKLPMLEL